MAITKGSYYTGEGPEIPSAGGDYGHPTPHAAKSDQHPFRAPSSIPSGNASPPADHAGWDAIDGLGEPKRL